MIATRTGTTIRVAISRGVRTNFFLLGEGSDVAACNLVDPLDVMVSRVRQLPEALVLYERVEHDSIDYTVVMSGEWEQCREWFDREWAAVLKRLELKLNV